MFWTVVLWVATTVLSYALQPKPQSQKPLGLGDVRAPTADEGREIPVLFGTRDLDGPNVVWYGHLRADAIRKKGGKK